jgi:outer membrane beta-barrel protein
MRTQLLALAATALLAPLVAVTEAQAQVQPAPQPANEQVIVPQVDRRELKIPKFPSNDFEINLFAGSYATQNFGTSAVTGVKLGYHITEDVFVQGAYARTKISDENYRLVFPSGIFPTPKRRLSYYNVSAGYNVLPGEIFIGRNIAKASAFYVIGGIGSTSFNISTFDQKAQTVNAGFGFRVLFTDRMALQLDVRDHIFTIDLLGKRDSTQNLELTGGFSYFF